MFNAAGGFVQIGPCTLLELLNNSARFFNETYDPNDMPRVFIVLGNIVEHKFEVLKDEAKWKTFLAQKKTGDTIDIRISGMTPSSSPNRTPPEGKLHSSVWLQLGLYAILNRSVFFLVHVTEYDSAVSNHGGAISSSAPPSTVLMDRDKMCKVCGSKASLEGAHIIGKVYGSSMIGGLNSIDDHANKVLLCPNHHSEFDKLRFTFYGGAKREFQLILTPEGSRVPSFRSEFKQCGSHVQFSEPKPRPSYFLWKLVVEHKGSEFHCPVQNCGAVFAGPSKSTQMSSHLANSHRGKKIVKEYIPVPKFCRTCSVPLSSCAAVYDHVVKSHLEILIHQPKRCRGPELSTQPAKKTRSEVTKKHEQRTNKTALRARR